MSNYLDPDETDEGEKGEQNQENKYKQMVLIDKTKAKMIAVLKRELDEMNQTQSQDDMKCISVAILEYLFNPDANIKCNEIVETTQQFIKIGDDNNVLYDLIQHVRSHKLEKHSPFLPQMVIILSFNDAYAKIRSNYRDLLQFRNVNKFKINFEKNNISNVVYDLVKMDRLFGSNPIKIIAEMYQNILSKIYFFISEYLKLIYMGLILCRMYQSIQDGAYEITQNEMEQLCDAFDALAAKFRKYYSDTQQLENRLKNKKEILKDIRSIIKKGKNNIFVKAGVLYKYLTKKYPWIAWSCISLDDRPYTLINNVGYEFVIKFDNGESVIAFGADRNWKLHSSSIYMHIKTLENEMKQALDDIYGKSKMNQIQIAQYAKHFMKINMLESMVFVCPYIHARRGFTGQFGFDDDDAIWFRTKSGYYVLTAIASNISSQSKL
eukprot:172756_1